MIYFNKQKYEINLNNENYHLIDKDTKQVKISCFTDLIQLDEDEWLYIKEVSENKKTFFHEENGKILFQMNKCLTQIMLIGEDVIYLRNTEGKTLYNKSTHESFYLNKNFGVEMCTFIGHPYLEIEIPEEEDNVLIGLDYHDFSILYIFSNRFQKEISSFKGMEGKSLEDLINYYLNEFLPLFLERAEINKNNMVLKKLFRYDSLENKID